MPERKRKAEHVCCWGQLYTLQDEEERKKLLKREEKNILQESWYEKMVRENDHDYDRGIKFRPPFIRLPDDRDIFFCDREAYETFNKAVEDGSPLGSWVKRMLPRGVLVTRMNYLNKPGWVEWNHHLCKPSMKRHMEALGFNLEDDPAALDKLYESLNSCMRAPVNYVVVGFLVSVTGNHEFHKEFVLNRERMRKLNEYLVEKGHVIKSSRAAFRFWYVPQDQRTSLADEVIVDFGQRTLLPDGKISCLGSRWSLPGLQRYVCDHKDESDFLPDEMPSSGEVLGEVKTSGDAAAESKVPVARL